MQEQQGGAADAEFQTQDFRESNQLRSSGYLRKPATGLLYVPILGSA